MEKRIMIEGMKCPRCTARVEKALNAIEGIQAQVDITGADISLSKDIADSILIQIVEKAGYRVTGIA